MKITAQELITVIRAALDCPSHFIKPTIVENDPDFKLGKNPLVICDQCVERMRKAIGLRKGEKVPATFGYEQKFQVIGGGVVEVKRRKNGHK